MTTAEITALLEKYYNGETDENEESRLVQFFLSGKVPEELMAEKEIFSFYLEEGRIPEPSPGFEKRIIDAVGNADNKLLSASTSRTLYTVLGAAAGLLLLIGSFFLFNTQNSEKDTFSDPQIAYAETLKILYNVSTKLNKGTEALGQVRKFHEATTTGLDAIEKSTGAFDRSMKNIDYFQKMLDIADSPMEYGKKDSNR